MKSNLIFQITLFMTIGFLAASGCNSSPSSPKTLNSAATVTVYEGLPHQLREADLLEREKQRPDIVTIGGFPFYTPSVAANETQATQLKKFLGDTRRYHTYTGEPRDCGPFHPDFAIEWTDGDSAHRILICFSCTEARILSENSEDTYDFNGISELKPLLSEFSSKRPKD